MHSLGGLLCSPPECTLWEYSLRRRARRSVGQPLTLRVANSIRGRLIGDPLAMASLQLGPLPIALIEIH